MVAPNSYEEHVLSLVNGKQHLFDNVISEDATEDVVGVSKKLLETLVDDLNTTPGEKTVTEKVDEESIDQMMPTAEDTGRVLPASTASSAVEEAITTCIIKLQQSLGPRIERIMGSGGGILAVIDRVDSEADQLAADLSETVPVALIDQRTLRGLERLRVNSPVTQGQTYFDRAEQAPDALPSRLKALAAEKFKAATLLAGQNCISNAMELLLSALLALASDRAGLDAPLQPQEAGVWIYSEAVPKGMMSQEEIGLIMRALTLAQAPSLPEELLTPLLAEVTLLYDL